MRLRAPNPAERVIIRAFFDELKRAREDEDNHDCRNMIYDHVARRTGVTYDRVVDLCHNRIYTEEAPGIHYHGWQMGTV